MQSSINLINKGRIKRFLMKNSVLSGFVLFLIVFSFIKPNFWYFDNIHNILLDASIIGVVGCATTFALISGHFDLSVGSQYACCQIAFISFLEFMPPILAIILTLIFASILGSVNGIITVFGKINPFITTLSTMTIYKGLALVYTNGELVGTTNEAVIAFGNAKLFGLSYLIYIFFGIAVISAYVLRYTTFGRKLFATGGNYNTALLSGINVIFYKYIVFVILGVASGVAGMMLVALVRAGSVLYGSQLALTTISAAIIGGTSFVGGKGTIIGTIFGVLIISILYKVLFFLGMESYYQNIVKGIVLMVVVVVDSYFEYKNSMIKGK